MKMSGRGIGVLCKIRKWMNVLSVIVWSTVSIRVGDGSGDHTVGDYGDRPRQFQLCWRPGTAGLDGWPRALHNVRKACVCARYETTALLGDLIVIVLNHENEAAKSETDQSHFLNLCLMCCDVMAWVRIPETLVSSQLLTETRMSACEILWKYNKSQQPECSPGHSSDE